MAQHLLTHPHPDPPPPPPQTSLFVKMEPEHFPSGEALQALLFALEMGKKKVVVVSFAYRVSMD